MKKINLLCLILLCYVAALAQDFEIVSVGSLPNDFAARDEMKVEPITNGRQCAVLRIATQNITPEQRAGFTFKTDKGSYLVQRADRGGEIWLWVSPDLTWLKIIHKNMGQIDLYVPDYVSRIESLHTYKIVIRGTAQQPPIPDNGGGAVLTKQFLAFQVIPVNAVLEVNGEVWTPDATGGASRYLDLGTYAYRVRASDYFTEEGTVTLDDPDNTKVVLVKLSPNFAEVTLRVDADAEIWVNNQRKGIRSWTGQLGSGTYKVECRQINHETSVTMQEISPAMSGQTITLPAPKPIYGSLMVESVPNFAKLYVDGREVGTTPKSMGQILVGQHDIKLSKEGYHDYKATFTVTKGEMATVKAVLEEDSKDQKTFTVNGSKDEETFTVNGVSFTMKYIEGGTFWMGAQNTNTSGRNYDSEADLQESPVHSVTLNSYYMGETEVTQALWKAVMGSNPSHLKGDDLPVVEVSWNDCEVFIRRLNQLTGMNFRLPTEAEWEYAARGGNKSRGYKYAGSNTIDDVAVYKENSYNKVKKSPDFGTNRVKLKKANELGLYDMAGNVWEWCSDWYDTDYYSKSPTTNPAGPSSGSSRVLRSGSLTNDARHCRVSVRFNHDPADGNNLDIGFRLSLPAPKAISNINDKPNPSPKKDNTTSTKSFVPIRYFNPIAFTAGSSSLDAGYFGFDFSFGSVNKLVGWQIEFNMRNCITNNDMIMDFDFGAGPVFRLYADEYPHNVLLWYVGASAGYNFMEQNTNINSASFTLSTKLHYIHARKKPLIEGAGIGLFLEGFYGKFVSGTAYVWCIGVSWGYLGSKWP